jgi:predicted CopG family antitoxin
MAKKQRGYPSSRKKYEQNNPTISCRVSRQVYDRLQEIKKAEGKSMADILKAGLGLFEVKRRDEETIRQEAYDKGWEKGLKDAEALYAVTYRCSNCGKKMVVTSNAEKRAISEYMHDHGWCHGDCNNPGI